MRSPSRGGLILGLTLFLLVISLFWIKRKNLMLVHVFSDTSCACGDFHEEVSGLNILNPLRDRQPERAAEEFFHASSTGRCPTLYDTGLCQYSETQGSVRGWKLVNAKRSSDGIDLFYKLDSSRRASTSQPSWTGEGCVHLIRIAGVWRVASYGAYF